MKKNQMHWGALLFGLCFVLGGATVWLLKNSHASSSVPSSFTPTGKPIELSAQVAIRPLAPCGVEIDVLSSYNVIKDTVVTERPNNEHNVVVYMGPLARDGSDKNVYPLRLIFNAPATITFGTLRTPIAKCPASTNT